MHAEVFPIQGNPQGIYTGNPGPELDKAWRDLLQCLLHCSIHLELQC